MHVVAALSPWPKASPLTFVVDPRRDAAGLPRLRRAVRAPQSDLAQRFQPGAAGGGDAVRRLASRRIGPCASPSSSRHSSAPSCSVRRSKSALAQTLRESRDPGDRRRFGRRDRRRRSALRSRCRLFAAGESRQGGGAQPRPRRDDGRRHSRARRRRSTAAHRSPITPRRSRAHPRADFSYGRYVRFTGAAPPNPTKLWDEEPTPIRDPRRLAVRLMERCFLPHPAWAVRREAQMRAGPYDETLKRSQDYEMIVRLARGNEGAFVDARVLWQRRHVALRGPAGERTLVDHSIDKWIAYDAAFFRKFDQEWRAEDFGPFAACPPADAALAWLQRGVILFQRKVYDRAEPALRRYRQTLVGRSPSGDERRIAAGLLGCQHGVAEFADRRARPADRRLAAPPRLAAVVARRFRQPGALACSRRNRTRRRAFRRRSAALLRPRPSAPLRPWRSSDRDTAPGARRWRAPPLPARTNADEDSRSIRSAGRCRWRST